jgi:hypothetical protein
MLSRQRVCAQRSLGVGGYSRKIESTIDQLVEMITSYVPLALIETIETAIYRAWPVANACGYASWRC